jgi:hypothetical protein
MDGMACFVRPWDESCIIGDKQIALHSSTVLLTQLPQVNEIHLEQIQHIHHQRIQICFVFVADHKLALHDEDV